MAGYTVAVTDSTFGELETERQILEPLGCTLVGAQCRTEEEVLACCAQADFVLTQFAPVTARAIQGMQRARLIVRYGIGVDNVDLAAARSRNIAVCNVPDYCIDEVADHTLALMLALTRQVVRHAVTVQAGGWSAQLPLNTYHTLRDMTTGVVGCGRIGREVVRRLLPFKTRVLVCDPLLGAEEAAALGATLVPLERLLAESDLVSLHCPSTAQTQQMINARSLAGMQEGVLLVNMARGTLVDTAALEAALAAGRVGGAALDVTDPEPLPAESALRRMGNVVITSHVASASPRAVSSLRASVAQTVATALRGERVPNCVNGVV